MYTQNTLTNPPPTVSQSILPTVAGRESGARRRDGDMSDFFKGCPPQIPEHTLVTEAKA